MAVISFNRISGRMSKIGEVKRRYKVLYHAIVDDLTDDDIDDIYFGNHGCPQIGDQYSFDTFAYCVDVDIKEPTNNGSEPDDRLRRKVVATYETIDPQNLQNGQQGNIADRVPIRSRTSVDLTIPLVFDRDGNLIVNSAGIPFSPPLTAVVKSQIFTYEVYSTVFSDSFAAQYENKLNSKAIGRWDKYQVRCNRISAVDTYDPLQGKSYKITYEFQSNPDPRGWRIFVPDTSLMHFQPIRETDYTQKFPKDSTKWGVGNKRLERITLGGRQISQQTYIKNGVVIDPQDLIDGTVTPDYIYVPFYEFADFTQLPLDFSS